jgi:hypothetical protein
MDFESVNYYVGQQVKLTLINNFWYRAKILSASKESVTFYSQDGKTITVSPSAIIMIVPEDRR